MPLPPPQSRRHIHTRQLEIKGYRREDGLWDIEGHITDCKPFDYHLRGRGPLEAGDYIHEMWLRLTVDDSMIVQEVEAATDASPYTICPDVTGNFKRLVGLQIGPGWNMKARQKVGGVEGCTHITEMLAQMATAAMQTMWPEREKALNNKADPAKLLPLNSCYTWASDSPAVKEHFPEVYTGE